MLGFIISIKCQSCRSQCFPFSPPFPARYALSETVVFVESTRAKIDFYSERLKQLAGASFPAETCEESNKGWLEPVSFFFF